MSGIQSLTASSAQLASVSPQSQQSLQPFANLDLTSAQRSQLRSIFSAAKQNGTSPADVQKQVNAVLTPAQQQSLKGDLAAVGGHHHHHGQSGDATSSQSADGSTDALGVPATASQSASSAAAGQSASTSADATVLAIVTNLQNQSSAAQSTLNNTLQSKLVITPGASANAAGATTGGIVTSNATAEQA